MVKSGAGRAAGQEMAVDDVVDVALATQRGIPDA
jgi:hypothetical protein